MDACTQPGLLKFVFCYYVVCFFRTTSPAKFYIVSFWKFQTSKRKMDDAEKFQHLKYLIVSLLPFLKQIYEEQTDEIEIEASIQGMNF